MEKLLEISDLTLDPELQPRAAMDPATIEDYADTLRDEGRWSFPPVSVVFDGEKYWLWDGFHRLGAAKLAGWERGIPTSIQQGERAFALWRSFGANKTHGLRRSNADKRRATELALIAAPGRSDREIALHVGASHTLVQNIRKILMSTGNIASQTERVGADGRTINTGNIGGKALTPTLSQGEREEATVNIYSQTDYAPIWQLEQGVERWLSTCPNIESKIEILETIKTKSSIGRDYLEMLVTDGAGGKLPRPRRKGDVIQACNNVLSQLQQKKWREGRAERIGGMTCICGQKALQSIGDYDAIRCDTCGRQWGSVRSFEDTCRGCEKDLTKTLRAEGESYCADCWEEKQGTGSQVDSPIGGKSSVGDTARPPQFATCPRCNVATLEPGGIKKSCEICGWPGDDLRLRPAAQGPAISSPGKAQGDFDCPVCFDEGVVHVNGGAWCMACGVKWASVASFKLDLKNYEAQQASQAHERSLRALEAAAGSPESAAMVLEMERVQRLQKQAAVLFSRVLDTTIIEDLEALIALLEDFEMDTPPDE